MQLLQVALMLTPTVVLMCHKLRKMHTASAEIGTNFYKAPCPQSCSMLIQVTCLLVCDYFFQRLMPNSDLPTTASIPVDQMFFCKCTGTVHSSNLFYCFLLSADFFSTVNSLKVMFMVISMKIYAVSRRAAFFLLWKICVALLVCELGPFVLGRIWAKCIDHSTIATCKRIVPVSWQVALTIPRPLMVDLHIKPWQVHILTLNGLWYPWYEMN